MKNLLILFLVLLNTLNIFGQYENIEIDNSDGSDFLSEPFICISPYNTDNIVIGTNLSNAYYSHNGGFGWSKTVLTSDLGVWGDPSVIVDKYGNFYFFHLSNPPAGEGTWVDRIICQKSTDNGETWNVVSYFGLNGEKKNDKETAVVDRTNNNIYVTWTQADAYHSTNPLDSSIILFSSSTDMGQTWSAPKRLSKQAGNSSGDSETLRSAVPAIGPDGEIYVSWAGQNENGDLGIIFDKSTDFGETWLDNDIYASDFPGGSHFHIPGIWQQDDGSNPGVGWSVTACDTSGGEYNGNIYINWADQRNGTDNTDIWLIKSADGGNTWTSPIKVNTDSDAKHQFCTSMTIDQTTGYLYFIFYDRRNYSDNSTDVYVAVSKDGGDTFSNIKISNSPFVPAEDIFFGDFISIAAYDGEIRPAWTRLNGGIISINTAILESPLNIRELNTSFSENETFPNPFKNEIHFSFKLRKTSDVKLKFVDLFGKEITSLIDNEKLKPGRYVKTLNSEKLNLSSGIYYFSLSVNNRISTKKVVFIK